MYLHNRQGGKLLLDSSSIVIHRDHYCGLELFNAYKIYRLILQTVSQLVYIS